MAQLHTFLRLSRLTLVLPLKHEIRLSLDIQDETFFYFIRSNHKAPLFLHDTQCCEIASLQGKSFYQRTRLVTGKSIGSCNFLTDKTTRLAHAAPGDPAPVE